MDTLIGRTSRTRTALAYVAMFGTTTLLYLLIRERGQSLAAPVQNTPSAVHSGTSHESLLAQVLLALAVITLFARALGGVFERALKQPAVMGEIVAGLVLGPSVLGAISPAAYELLMPAAAASYLSMVAQIGVVLFMFLVGLQFDPKLLRGTTHATVAISHASILAPFLLGSALALGLYPRYGNGATGFTVFSMFLGVSMSVTAFPVLARILADRNMQATPLGTTAIACAAIDDATAWCLLALASGVASARVGNAAGTFGLAVGYVAFMYVAVRPLARWLSAREERTTGPVSRTVLAVVFVTMLLSAAATESIGIHALFGAFLLGALIPHQRLAVQIRSRLEDAVSVLLLPVFFAFTGMRTQLALVSSATDWAICGAIVAVATLGKLGGTAVAARVTGLSWRDAGALGILMNTRGLMELIVLNVGLDMGVLSPTLFTMMVIMAIVTTFATTPLLDSIDRARSRSRRRFNRPIG